MSIEYQIDNTGAIKHAIDQAGLLPPGSDKRKELEKKLIAMMPVSRLKKNMLKRKLRKARRKIK